MMTSDSRAFAGLEFTTVQFPAMRAFRTLGRLVKLAGPAIGALKGLTLETRLDDIMPSIGEALTNLDVDQAGTLAMDLLASTWAIGTDGKKVEFLQASNIDLVFSGHVRALMECLIWVVKWNFKDFMPGAAPATAAPPAVAAAPAPSP